MVTDSYNEKVRNLSAPVGIYHSVHWKNAVGEFSVVWLATSGVQTWRLKRRGNYERVEID
jgi:hypothetical protein